MTDVVAETKEAESSWWDKLWDGVVDVGVAVGMGYASTIGNTSDATATTTATGKANEWQVGGLTVTPAGIVFTVGGILGAIVLTSIAIKILK